jgi:signal transduction histidine kinase
LQIPASLGSNVGGRDSVQAFRELASVGPFLVSRYRGRRRLLRRLGCFFCGAIRPKVKFFRKSSDICIDFSKIEADKLDLDHTEFGLAEFVREKTASLSAKAQEKGPDLTIEIDRQVPERIVGDPVRLGQILVNLVGNAITFSGTGKIGIRVSVEEEPAADSVVLRFSVTDNGIGIAADKVGTVFEAFVQADGSTTRRYGGTGLGLSISRRLVEMMGRSISALGG